MDILVRIKRLALSRHVIFTRKAGDEMEEDGLTEDEVIESIVNARRVEKTLRSTAAAEAGRREMLYVIRGLTFTNVLVYTKGKIVRDADQESFYILISSKRAL